MKNIDKEINLIKKHIKEQQDAVTLIESVIILGKYNNIVSPFTLKKEGFEFDVANATFQRLSDEILEDLVNKSPIVTLSTKSNAPIFQRLGALRNSIDDLTINRIYRSLNIVENSLDYIKIETNKSEINIIELLIENNQIESLLKLIVSNKINSSRKIEIIKLIIKKYPEVVKKYPDFLNQIDETVPKDYCNSAENPEKNKENFKILFNEKLQEAFKGFMMNELHRSIVNPDIPYQYECEKIDSLRIVEFLINHNLFNLDNIRWTVDNYTHVSSVSACFNKYNYLLGYYLYSLKSYKQLDTIIKNNDDEYILKLLIYRSNIELNEFISQPNFEITPDKLNYLFDLILYNEKIEISEKDLEKIISVILKKIETQNIKKEDLEEINNIIKNAKISMLENKTKTLTK